MQLFAYSIYDKKAECYGIPFFKSKDMVAIRDFTSIVNDERSSLYQFPGDYDLYRVGHFLDGSGLMSAEKPTFLVNASSVKRSIFAGTPVERVSVVTGKDVVEIVPNSEVK